MWTETPRISNALRRASRLAVPAVALALAAALFSGEATACPNCYGKDTQVLRGFYWSWALLTLLPFAVVGGIAGYVVAAGRRARRNHPPDAS